MTPEIGCKITRAEALKISREILLRAERERQEYRDKEAARFQEENEAED